MLQICELMCLKNKKWDNAKQWSIIQTDKIIKDSITIAHAHFSRQSTVTFNNCDMDWFFSSYNCEAAWQQTRLQTATRHAHQINAMYDILIYIFWLLRHKQCKYRCSGAILDFSGSSCHCFVAVAIKCSPLFLLLPACTLVRMHTLRFEWIQCSVLRFPCSV